MIRMNTYIYYCNQFLRDLTEAGSDSITHSHSAMTPFFCTIKTMVNKPLTHWFFLFGLTSVFCTIRFIERSCQKTEHRLNLTRWRRGATGKYYNATPVLPGQLYSTVETGDIHDRKIYDIQQNNANNLLPLVIKCTFIQHQHNKLKDLTKTVNIQIQQIMFIA